MSRRRALPGLVASLLATGCVAPDAPAPDEEGTERPRVTAATEEPSPSFRNVEAPTEYVGDAVCATCHEEAATAYAEHGMARSFHAWSADGRVEPALENPIRQGPSGFEYDVVEVDGGLVQIERLVAPDGRTLHELRRSMDWVMGSGNVARTYFTEENGRLFQLPLTWYSAGGWDFSPGYEVNNARFSRLMPDRCLACHASYPEPIPFLEGKYAALEPGIGCERCHGPGALHVAERSAEAEADPVPGPPATADGLDTLGPAEDGAPEEYDDTIVNPRHLPFERRLDVCEQCHVHTPVTVLREGRGAFDYLPSEPLGEHIAIFKPAGSIDIVSHADRLRQSACFVATRASAAPLECATCHDPHEPVPDAATRNRPCAGCHAPDALLRSLEGSDAIEAHVPDADCTSCHMPAVKERTVPHGTFTDHWIRVVDGGAEPTRPADAETHVEPYFERDRAGPESSIYRHLGEVVYATLATDGALLREAADGLERALAAGGARPDASFLLGLAYRQLGREADAIRALERSLAIEPDRPSRLHALARALEATGAVSGDSIEALYERALALQPALAFVQADYADFLAAEGRVEEAEAAYRAALDERPSLAIATFNLGALLAGEERFEEATRIFERAVRLSPAFAEALSPLFQVRVSGSTLAGARVLGSPIERLPVRDRGPGAARLAVGGTRPPSLAFLNVPPGASVAIHEPGGALIRGLRGADGAPVRWDLRNESGRLVAGGLYEARVRGPEGFPPQSFYFGIVRSDEG